MIRVTVLGPIVAQGRPRFTTQAGYVQTYDPPKSVAFKRMISHYARAAMKGRVAMKKPVEVDIQFYFSPPKSWSEKKKQAALCGDLRHACKPDIDNLVKTILDGINGIVFDDDEQVVVLNAVKLYGTPERVEVSVEEV
jgi:Holliday junction resolvase RusA-like endonuclease